MTSRVLRIRTPEGVVFSQTLAGPVIRFSAWFVDLMVISGAMGVLGAVISIFGLISRDFMVAVYTLLYFVLSIGYGFACEWRWRGQTIGKRLFRLRVVDAEGLKLQFHQVVIRNLLRFVDSLPYFYAVGGAACWISPKFQRLGDLAANTIVVRIPQITEPDVEQLTAGIYNSLSQYPQLVARLRQKISPSEASLALQALLRRDDFDPKERLTLFAALGQHFRAKVPFPPEATDGITEEQYLRNIVGLLYSTKQKAPDTWV